MGEKSGFVIYTKSKSFICFDFCFVLCVGASCTLGTSEKNTFLFTNCQKSIVKNPLKQHFSKCGLGASSISFTWELIRNANY